MGAAQPGLLLKIEGEATTYQVVSVVNSNTLTVSPNFTSSFTNRPILVAQLLKWPDLSGNREHMGFWAVADTHNPGTYILDSASGKIFRDGHIYHFGNGKQAFSGLNTNDVLRIGHPPYDNAGRRNPVVVHELIIAGGSLTESQRSDIEGYLAWKWQSQEQLPTQHNYATVSPTSSWNPTLLGNALWMWLDANRSDHVFADTACNNAAVDNGQVSCWQDLSSYNRHVYQNANFPIRYTTHNGLKGIYIKQNSQSNPASLSMQGDATWLNNQNFFIAMVAQKAIEPDSSIYRGGPLIIGEKPFFPFIYAHCIGVEAVNGNPAAYTQYTRQRSTLVLQGNVRNQLFYEPCFNKNIPSSLTTRSAPLYLHEQPYLLAVVANFVPILSSTISWGKTLLGTIIPGGNYDFNIYTNRYLGFGSTIKTDVTTAGRLWLDHGWNDYDYNIDVSDSPTVYLAWFKSAGSTPFITVNGLPIPFRTRNETRSNGYLQVLQNELTMLSMGDYGPGNHQRTLFSGRIYEAMVLTGSKIRYGHQRLIEGYLAWKWGLQHKLPRSHSYRRVPPAR
jgi:hypothetical protein